MQMQHILSLVALSEAGSIRSAAASLGRSQPGLTKNLRQIEDELGVRLFQRTSRGVIPTKIGQLVLARTRTIATDIRRLQEEVEHTKGGQHGSVSVCVSPLAATQIIPAALLSFRRRFPEVDVQISSGLFPLAIVPLREGQTDIVVGPRPPADQSHSLIVEPLVTTDIVIVTSKSSPHAKARSIGDLSDADWMMIGSPGGPGDIFEPVFRENGFRSPSHALPRNLTWRRSKSYGLSAWSAHFRVVFFANKQPDIRT
jgi:LysR family transcriptional regulator of abg operon